MPVGGTWLIPAAIGAAGVTSAVVGANAAKSAANTQATAANTATALNEKIFNQQQANVQPFIANGSGASSALARLLGYAPTAAAASGGGAVAAPAAPSFNSYLAANPDLAAEANRVVGNDPRFPDVASYLYWHQQNYPNENRPVTVDPTPTAAPQVSGTAATGGNGDIEAALQALPGYQFTRDQGIQSVNRTLGSLGQTGAQAKGISRFVTGLADSTYNSQVQNLQNATNTGANAAVGAGSNAVGAGSNIANTIVGAGSAQAAGQVGAANAITGGISSIPNTLLLNSLLTKNPATTPGSNGMYGDLPLGTPGG